MAKKAEEKTAEKVEKEIKAEVKKPEVKAEAKKEEPVKKIGEKITGKFLWGFRALMNSSPFALSTELKRIWTAILDMKADIEELKGKKYFLIMADSIKIDAKQMIQFAKNIGDTSTLKRIYNNAFQNMLDELASLSKKNHSFTSRSKWLENNVATELQDKLGFVFVDNDVVPYAKFVYDGTNPHIIKAKNIHIKELATTR